MVSSVLYSSNTELWGTPQKFFDDLNKEFDFDLDPCALPSNAKCARYFTPKEDGLAQDWGGQKCSAILRMAKKYRNGCVSVMKKVKNLTRWLLCFCQQERIRHTFTIISTIRLRYDLSGVGCILMRQRIAHLFPRWW